MTKDMIAVYDHETGENIVREMTAAEKAAREADRIRLESQLAAEIAAKESAQAKLAQLGLTTDDLKALGL